MTAQGAGSVRARPTQDEPVGADVDPLDPGHAVPAGPIGIRCLACGSDDLDASEHPRGDEVVQCRPCGEWNTYRVLELAAIEAVRRELARRLAQ
jgi:hypothetical protein